MRLQTVSFLCASPRFPYGLLLTGLLLLGDVGAAVAQAPLVQAVTPPRNHLTAPRSTAVAATFSQPLGAGATTGLRVFSHQAGGQRAGAATVSGSTLSLDPSQDFQAGETVQATLTTAVSSTGGTPLARPYVWQFTTAVAASTGVFSGGSIVSVSEGQGQICPADIDADGDLDLLVPDANHELINVRRNDGTGVFTPTADIPARGPAVLATGDMDGDGDLDAVTIDQDAANNKILCVRLNSGNGTFTIWADLALNAGSYYDLALADFDGDGDLDAATIRGSSILILLNDGSGVLGFYSTATWTSPSFPTKLTVGDVNGDGALDVVAINGSNATAGVCLNSGTGRLALPSFVPTYSNVKEVALADLDADGDLDLIASKPYTGVSPSGTIAVRFNDGAGVFTGTQSLAVNQLVRMKVADVDGDGDVDMLTTSASDNVTTYLNAGTGTFSPGSITRVVGEPTSLALADLDGDGDLDLATTSTDAYPVGRVTIRLNGGQPPAAFSLTAVAPTAHARSVAPAATVTATFSQAPAATPTTLGGLRLFSTQTAAYRTATATVSGSTLALDPAGDFRPGDRISATLTKRAQLANGAPLGQPHVWQFTAATAPATCRFVATTDTVWYGIPQKLHFADLDNDGALDLITTHWGGQTAIENTLTIQRNLGSGRFATTGISLNGSRIGAWDVATGDVDRDGDLDLVAGAASVGSVGLGNIVLLNNGQGSFRLGAVVSGVAGDVELGDIDGDGDLDAVFAGDDPHSTMSVRYNDGTGNFYGSDEPRIGSDNRAMALTDLDNDGDLDVLTSSTDRFMKIGRNDGNGHFTPDSAGVWLYNWFEEFTLGDIDGDGDVDMITSPGVASKWLNDGTGHFAPVVDTTGVIGGCLALGDLDGDGDLDLTSYVYNGVRLLFNDGAGNFTGNRVVSVGPANPYYQALKVTLGDLNGDGTLDLVSANDYGQGSPGGWSVRLNDFHPAATAAETRTAAFTCWPNPTPAGSLLRVSIPSAVSSTLTLSTLLGQPLRKQCVAGATADLATTGLPPGVYLLCWQTEGHAPVTRRVVIE
jgi:FG-GAP-like repeat/Bacterial Ig-like domain